MSQDEKEASFLVTIDPATLQDVFNKKITHADVSSKIGNEWKHVGYVSWSRSGKSLIVKIFTEVK